MKTCKQHLIIFTRYPEPGKTKTRLIPAVGEIGAANLHQQMTESTISQVQKLANIIRISVEIRFTGGNLQKMQNWLGNDLEYQTQGEGDLGIRMERSLTNAFQQKAEQVIIIGTDCPSLNSQILATAFQQLKTFNLVLGPAVDGGYYLIGLQQPIPELFTNIHWGTDQVLIQTLKIAQNHDLSIYSLPPLADIDRPDDLKT
ncbi:MAG: TIGR04282 family arsenosugar biosynthesis glycosyltransferase [Cuspidothrix sp.]